MGLFLDRNKDEYTGKTNIRVYFPVIIRISLEMGKSNYENVERK